MKKRMMMIATLVMAICNIIKAEDKITISDFLITTGNMKEMSISLENTTQYVAFQFDLYLPEGITVDSYSADPNRLPKSTSLSMKKQKDGSYRFISLAIEGEPLVGNSGSIVILTLKATEEMAVGEMTGYFRKVKLSKADATGSRYEEIPFPITVKEGIVPMTNLEEVSFGEEIDEETDLSDTVIENTYLNMDTDNGDGYDAEEQAIVMNSTVTEEQMNTVQEAEVGDDEVVDSYNGIIIQVPAGIGTITVDAKTIGTHVLNVQIGKEEATKVTQSERGTVDVPYKVKETTYVYLYASTSGASARLHRAPSADANSVLLYGYKIDPYKLGDADADRSIDVNDVTSTINHILKKSVVKFVIELADVDGDGVIDVNDVQGIIDKALGK